jgi:predicted Zn-dependent protease
LTLGTKLLPIKNAMKDRNICPYCEAPVHVEQVRCKHCRQRLALDSKRKISIWQLGKVRAELLASMAAGLRNAFLVDVVIQPGFLDPRPSERPQWRGLSATVFLNQVYRRHKRGGFVSIGVTEENIVPDALHNFLFGYAYLGLPAAVVSLHPLIDDDPTPDVLTHRLLSIAVHEIGHTLGLDHHDYDEGVDCVMVGDDQLDSLDTVDEGSVLFCKGCMRTIASHRRS